MPYTTKPSTQWEGYTEVYEGEHYRGSCPTAGVDDYLRQIEKASHDHWQGVLDRADNPRTVIANGHAYWIGSPSDYPRGFGGQNWLITFHDGHSVKCCSLWHSGEVPLQWRDRLPDNATLRAI